MPAWAQLASGVCRNMELRSMVADASLRLSLASSAGSSCGINCSSFSLPPGNLSTSVMMEGHAYATHTNEALSW